VTKKQPLTLEHFEEFFKLLPQRASSERSWRVSAQELKAKNYDLKAINPNRKQEVDSRTPEELLSIIEAQGKEISNALAALRNKDAAL
jgi:type I restriction enzyme M protein